MVQMDGGGMQERLTSTCYGNGAMDPFATRTIGRTEVRVTQLGCGGATLGGALESIPENQADATLEAAYDAGIRYFDTAPWYGSGRSEHRFGRLLRTRPRDSFVISTKVGRVFFRPKDPRAFEQNRTRGGLPFDLRFDYTRDGVRRSYEDSLMRLGINTVDALLIHDLDFKYHQTEEGVEARLRELDTGGGFAALDELKRSGEIRAIGAGINETGMIPRFLRRFDLDFFIVAMPYTLLNQDALEDELALCVERGAGVVIGAPFASGILATGAGGGGRYGYQSPPAAVVEKTQRIEAICRRYDVPLGAAALQFPLGHPAVASVIPGPNHPDQVRQNVEWMRHDIPAGLWADLKSEGLVRHDAPAP
jgi:D-threo-aldose 1-dehydrogenase